MSARETDQGEQPEQPMQQVRRILGVETSCDETAASVVELRGGRLRVLSSCVHSQHQAHERYSGVVPELASRLHLTRIIPEVQMALDEAHLTLDDINAVAVGHRPGLIGSLLVGVAAAKALAWSRGVPFLGVDHVAAHLVAGLLDQDDIKWPAVGLVVSGGHTHLMWLESPTRARVLGKTIDDAVGEAYDKAGVILGLEYPGGPRVDAAASRGNELAVNLPIPRPAGALDFSFSGLKTALLYAARGVPAPPRKHARAERGEPSVSVVDRPAPLLQERVQDLAASFQRAAVTHLVQRTERALAARPAPTLIVGGGVSANSRLRRDLAALCERVGVRLRLPETRYCMDNAAMIAGLAHYRLTAGESDPLDLAPMPQSSLLAVDVVAEPPPPPAAAP